MRVKVLFFGVLRDIAGKAEEHLEIAETATLGSILDHYSASLPSLAALRPSILAARNQQFARPSTPVAEGDEIALLPPVSGGSGPFTHEVSGAGSFFALTRLPINVSALKDGVLVGAAGAVVTFEGVARDNTKGRRTLWLEYESYENMAIRVLADLGAALASEFPISRLAIVHRLGRMEIGETSVAIVISAPHRKAAFEACSAAIDHLKRTVPIWKKEHFEDGEIWVEGAWDSSLASQ